MSETHSLKFSAPLLRRTKSTGSLLYKTVLVIPAGIRIVLGQRNTRFVYGHIDQAAFPVTFMGQKGFILEEPCRKAGLVPISDFGVGSGCSGSASLDGGVGGPFCYYKV